MLFNSFSYLIFFPVVVVLYFAIPHRVRYIWLLAASYYFYMSWNPKYALLMALSTLITYLSGLLIGGAQKKTWKNFYVFLSMASNLSILFLFKYFDFFVDNMNRILAMLNMEMVNPTFDVILPVGISFYTFQALSYTMDVYRGDIYVEKNFFKYALFVSLFPQLVAGPIERSKNLLVQISRRHYFDYERAKSGLVMMLWGLFLKLVIADRMALLVDKVYGNFEEYEGIAFIIATLFFGIQIYCDFSSYSLIAKGSARVMGFTLMDNFKQPYFARSIGEFWHRWHISLSTWFRDYLYIPLGGNRKGTFRKYVNIMIVFLVSGLWHGANWTFIVWGFLHGSFQVIGQITRPLKDWLAAAFGLRTDSLSYKIGQMFITYLLVNFAWIFFRAPNMSVAFEVIRRMFTVWNPWIIFDGSLFELGLSSGNFFVGICSLLMLLAVSLAQYRGVAIGRIFAEQGYIFRSVLTLILLFAIILFGVYGPGYNAGQFIYFQF